MKVLGLARWGGWGRAKPPAALDRALRRVRTRLLFVCLVFCVSISTSRAQSGPEGHGAATPPVKKPRVFLDKNPRIVAYQLRRLANEQLLLIDRTTDHPKYNPVYEAILRRAGMSRQYREEAARALVELNQSNMIRELMSAIRALDPRDTNQWLAQREIAGLLLRQPADHLADQHQILQAATRGSEPAVRQIAYAALIASGASERAWSLAVGSVDRRTDLMSAIALVPHAGARSGLRDYVLSCLDDEQSLTLRRAAIAAMAHIPGEETATFRRITPGIGSAELRSVTIRSLLQIPKSKWPTEGMRSLVDSLIEVAQATPPAARTHDDFLDAIRLADQLLTRLPLDESRALRQQLRSITVRVVLIRTVLEEMRYDQPYFVVEAGRPVQLILRNDDLMPHNLVITSPGSLRAVAQSAARMTPAPDAQGRQYVPAHDDVLFATPMVQANRQTRLTFAAPTELGEYPFVCTFPRHWLRMHGVMVVVEDVDAWRANPQPPADPLGSHRTFVRSWKFEDLTDELPPALHGRHFEIGQRLFTEATCAQCHKLRGKGGAVGPDLSDLFQRWKNDRPGILREILDPSHKVDAKYAVHVVVVDGQVLSGIVAAQDKKSITIVTNPESPAPRVVERAAIEEMRQTSTSMMPRGLLDKFTRDEIFELFAYLEAGGDPMHSVFHKDEDQ